MKTVFITIFEGVEAKNILRTEILAKLLKDPEIKVVLFTKSQERIDYYKKEFYNERLSYECVDSVSPRTTYLESLFRYLKFLLLRTDTTNIRRRLALQTKRDYLSYSLGHFFNIFLAHRPVRKLVRYLDFTLVRDTSFAAYFDKYRPDLVFLAHLFEDHEIHFLREAKRRKIKTVGLVNSWDKVTARAIMRLLPEKIVVFNEIVKAEMMRYNDVAGENIFVSGLPQYDHYFKEPISSREAFFQKIGVHPRNKLIVYAPFGRSFSSYDWEMADVLYRLNQEGRFGGNIAILVRFQPNDFVDEKELKKRPNLLYDYPGKRFSSKRGVDWDMNFDELAHLRDTLSYMALLICWAGSIGIDAAVFDKPVINLGFNIRPHVQSLHSPLPHYSFTHYKKVLAIGGIRFVRNEEEMTFWINEYLRDPLIDQDKRRALVKQECNFFDGKSGKRIAEYLKGCFSRL